LQAVLRRGLRYVDELSEASKQRLSLASTARDLIGYGLRGRLREGYDGKDFRADLQSSLAVGVVALPLSMAFAIAIDVPPQHGLYSAIIAGLICALLGGTRFQVTGPTAAFVVILVPIVHQYGLSGLLVAGMLAGVILLLMGLARLGRFIELVPHPVTTGLTMGIAVVIGLFQLKDAFGVTLPKTEGTFEYLAALWDRRGDFNPWDAGITVLTVGLLLALPKVGKRVPVPLAALAIVSLLVILAGQLIPDFHAATIGSKFHYTIGNEKYGGIPPLPPLPMLPWDEGGINYHMIRQLLPAAFAIAMLGAIESLMTAVVADGISGTDHDPNAELMALGIANIICPFFGGMAATGALARTATNIRAGARSPFSAALHAVFLLACTIALAPFVSYLPVAGLAGLLIIVARNMSEARHFVRLARIAPVSDVMVMLACFVLTVAFDMVVAVLFGVLLAAILLMKRTAVLARANLASVTNGKLAVPRGIRLYQIAGPLFFGAAKTAMETLDNVGIVDHTIILDMQNVPTIDATGLVALESVLDRLRRSKIKVIFAGIHEDVREILEHAGIKRVPGSLAYAPDVETAISMAIVHAARISSPALMDKKPPPDEPPVATTAR
jgi:sulfate permease, SulP family